MKFFKCLTIFIVLLTSCKSGKNLTDKKSTVKKISAKKILKKHISENFNFETVDAKLKVDFKNEKQDVGFSVKMKIKKDEIIWLKGTKLITVFKAKITPNKVSFYSPYYKNYIEGDFKMLEKILGVTVNFNQLQNMLLGQVMFDASEKHTVELIEGTYKLAPKNQQDLFDVFYWLNPLHYKLDKQSLINESKKQRLDIEYASYKQTDDSLFPQKILIKGKGKNKLSTINMFVRSTIINQKLEMPFKIPTGYKEIKL